jgi:aldehyde dehydrogenase (NAD+)
MGATCAASSPSDMTTAMDHSQLCIGGKWVAPTSTARILVNSASTEELVGYVPEAQEADVDAAVEAARRVTDDPNGWAHWSLARRAEAMERLADVLERRSEDIVAAVSVQNGLPV